jgi:hypothetical protein
VVPPLADREFEYAAPWVPEGTLDVVIARAAAVTAIDRLTDLACAGLPESATLAVKLNVPAAVGVPEIRPVLEARESPAGSAPEEMDHA